MNLREFRELLNTNEEGAIALWNEQFKKGLDVNQASKEIGFSWGAVRGEIYALGYEKPKNKLISKVGEQGESIKMNKEIKLTEAEILFIKELYQNKDESISDFNITSYKDYKQRSILISESLLERLNEIYNENDAFRKQDIFNKVLELGIDTYFKNFNK